MSPPTTATARSETPSSQHDRRDEETVSVCRDRSRPVCGWVCGSSAPWKRWSIIALRVRPVASSVAKPTGLLRYGGGARRRTRARVTSVSPSLPACVPVPAT
jgi:hypothetical protein